MDAIDIRPIILQLKREQEKNVLRKVVLNLNATD